MPRKPRASAAASTAPPVVPIVHSAPSMASASSVANDQMSTSGSTSGRDILFYGFGLFVREISGSSRTAAHDLGTDLSTFPAFCASVPDGSAIIVDLLTSFASSLPGPEWRLLLDERFKTFLTAVEAVVDSTNSIPVSLIVISVFITFRLLLS